MAAREDASPEHQISAEQPRTAAAVEMHDVVKHFGATLALNRVHFEARSGEIHALLGENGAGKSTLMHVLTGLIRPDAGQIRVNGKRVQAGSAREARTFGIAMVHQHFALVPAFTVAENLALDGVPGKALERAAALGWSLDPKARIADLSVGAQQRVEIARALATDARVLIFDEPTAVLTESEILELFTVLRRLRDQGCAVVLIAHKLSEILAVADRVTVLRRGSHITTCDIADTDAPQLALWMLGETPPPDAVRPSMDPEPDGEHTQGLRRHAPPPRLESSLIAVGLTVLGDRGEEAIRSISLSIAAGEIFGIAGVDGNGQTELAEALVGLRPLRAETISWEEGAFQPGSAPATGYIPPDRRRAGLAPGMTVEENLLFGAVRERQYRRGPFLRRKALRQMAMDLVEEFDIRITSLDARVSTLSGGNQQKIVVARALRANPRWIVAVNPTRGLDIGATRFVQEQLLHARQCGAAILLISTDLDELAALADRAAILSSGRLSEYSPRRRDNTGIGLLLGGVAPTGPESHAEAEASAGRGERLP